MAANQGDVGAHGKQSGTTVPPKTSLLINLRSSARLNARRSPAERANSVPTFWYALPTGDQEAVLDAFGLSSPRYRPAQALIVRR